MSTSNEGGCVRAIMFVTFEAAVGCRSRGCAWSDQAAEKSEGRVERSRSQRRGPGRRGRLGERRDGRLQQRQHARRHDEKGEFCSLEEGNNKIKNNQQKL